jgi:dTMP kinase
MEMSTNQSEQYALPRGIFVAIEGIDGSGKTTQARMLVEYLNNKGYKAIFLFEPTNQNYGARLREQARTGRVSPEEEFRLFLLDREEDVKLNIQPALDAGKIVVIDRYLYSSMAYQGARGLDPEMIRVENEKIAPRADIVLYLKIPVDIGRGRITKDRNDSLDLFESKEYQQKVADIYEDMVRSMPEFVVVDASGDLETVHEEIIRIMEIYITSLIKDSQSR